MEPAKTTLGKTLYCSFCFKSQHDVTKLISGPAAVFICSKCIDSCNAFISERGLGATPRQPEELPTQDILHRLSAVELTLVGKSAQLQALIEVLRSREVSWADIGGALGMSRQSAWERFS
jgi:ATP-dependent Clp protease ATP-binding subunit ClpX